MRRQKLNYLFFTETPGKNGDVGFLTQGYTDPEDNTFLLAIIETILDNADFSEQEIASITGMLFNSLK